MSHFIGKYKFTFKDIAVYPDKQSDDFKSSLERVTKKIKRIEPNTLFKSLPQQASLLRIVSIYAPYRSFVFYHDMGTGKTITTILVIEKMKPFLIEHNTKALILVPNHLIQKTTFVKELLGKIKHKGKTMYKRWCTGLAYISKRLRKMLNNARTENERKKLEREILQEKIYKFYEITTHKKWEQQWQNASDELIKKTFSNRIIVVDEIQRAKNLNSQFYSVLEKVLRIAENTYLFVLSGTPMVDDPAEICQPINLCRINEGYSELLTAKTVRDFYSKDASVQQKAQKKINKLTKGFVSRVKGENSKGSPKRIDMGDILCCNDLDEKFKVVFSRLHGKQLEEYLKSFFTEFLASSDSDPNEMWNQSRKICRGIWGESEIRSQKFEDIWTNSRIAIGQGVIVNYSYFIGDGINQFERFLLTKKETTQFEGVGCKSQKEVVYNFSNLQTDQYKNQVIEILGNYDNYDGKIIQWVLGTLKIGQGITICMATQVNLIGSPWNIATAEQFIKKAIRIGTHIFPKYSEMYGTSWNNTVQVYRYCARILPQDYSTISEFIKNQTKRFIEQNRERLKEKGFLDENDNLRTIDEYIYRRTFKKHCKIQLMDKFLSDSSFHYVNLSNENPSGSVSMCESATHLLLSAFIGNLFCIFVFFCSTFFSQNHFSIKNHL